MLYRLPSPWPSPLGGEGNAVRRSCLRWRKDLLLSPEGRGWVRGGTASLPPQGRTHRRTSRCGMPLERGVPTPQQVGRIQDDDAGESVLNGDLGDAGCLPDAADLEVRAPRPRGGGVACPQAAVCPANGGAWGPRALPARDTISSGAGTVRHGLESPCYVGSLRRQPRTR